jgi:hypothetical protein
LRPMTKEPHLRDRVQKCVKPRKSNPLGIVIVGPHYRPIQPATALITVKGHVAAR